MILLIAVVILAIVCFWGILQMDIPGLWKFVLVAIEMFAVSQFFIKRYGLSSELGLVLLKSKKGIDIIEAVAKKGSILTFFTDAGNSIAYGLLSLVLTKKQVSIKSFVFGIATLLILSFVIAPFTFIVLFQSLNTGTDVGSVSDAAGDFGFYAVFGLLIFGGLFLFILSGIIYYGAVVLNALANSIIFGTNAIANTSPGGTFLLPGVNLPFFEGIIALTIVMIVHEGAHAVLARIAKIPVESSGIVLFGIIPVGAFVEPDEKKLQESDPVHQTRVLVAGSTSNLYTSIIFFLGYIILTISTRGIENFAIDFIRTTLGLTFALNFIVGAVNLLPLPLFDGYRIISVNVKNSLVVKGLMYITLAFFILNFLPWLFRP